MSATDKIRNTIQEVTGYAQEKVGGVTGNQRPRTEGRDDSSKSNLEQAVGKLDDAFE